MSERAVPFHCPYCGDEDLRPAEPERHSPRPDGAGRPAGASGSAGPATGRSGWSSWACWPGASSAATAEGAGVTAVEDDGELAALAARAGRELEDAPALDVLEWAAGTFGERFCVTSSMEDAVVAHLASRVLPGVDVVFLDTGYHFPETIGTRDAVAAVMDVNVVTLTPRRTVAEQDAAYGPELYDRDPDLCCALRKVEPLEEAWPGTPRGRPDCAATSRRPGRAPRSSAGTPGGGR